MPLPLPEIRKLIFELGKEPTSDPYGIVGSSYFLTRCLEQLDRYAEMINAYDAEKQRALSEMKLVSLSKKPLLIYGENGTGKDLLVTRLRSLLKLRDRFYEYSCVKASSTEAALELFGDDKNRRGLIQEANEAVLFLNELQTLPTSVQTQMNSLVDSGVIWPKNANLPVEVDTVLIAATNEPCRNLIQQGRLNQDFYYRLNTYEISLPLLRDRPDDIPRIIESKLTQLCRSYETSGRSLTRNFTDEAIYDLVNCSWNGNVRELENTICRIFIDYLRHDPDFRIDREHIGISPEHVPGPAQEVINVAYSKSETDDLSGHRAKCPDSTPQTGQSGSMPSRSKHLLVLATEWNSGNGGVSTFSRLLCASLAAAGHMVCCLVPTAQHEEIIMAEDIDIKLISARQTVGGGERELLLRPPKLPEDFEPEIVIGHDRITGGAAIAQVADSFPNARSVVVMHTEPGEIEWYKPEPDAGLSRAEKAEVREIQQRELADQADMVVAVGPRLRMATESIMVGMEKKPIQFDPGLIEIEQSLNLMEMVNCLVLGRAEDFELKGLDIAAKAVGIVSDSFRGTLTSKPRLVVRGAVPDTADILQRKLKEIGGANLTVSVKQYTSHLGLILQDLKRASVLLMPSRAEGFGLVGLEALSAGVPLLISSQSGLADLIQNVIPKGFPNPVIRVTGNLEIDSKEWATAIEDVLKDRHLSVSRVRKLAELYSKKISWEKSVLQLLEDIS